MSEPTYTYHNLRSVETTTFPNGNIRTASTSTVVTAIPNPDDEGSTMATAHVLTTVYTFPDGSFQQNVQTTIPKRFGVRTSQTNAYSARSGEGKPKRRLSRAVFELNIARGTAKVPHTP